LLYFTKTHLYLSLPYRKILSIIIEKSKLYFFTFYEIGDRALTLRFIP